MKILFTLIFLAVSLGVYAAPVTLTIQTDTEEVSTVEAIVLDAQQWLQDAWDGKVNKCLERVINEESNLNPNKLTQEEKKAEVKKINPEKRKDKENQ